MRNPNNLAVTLQEKGELVAGTMIDSILIQNLVIYGFVPEREFSDYYQTVQSCFPDCSLSSYDVYSDRIKFKEKAIPFAKRIVRNEKSYKVELEKVYISEMHNDAEYNKYRHPFKTANANRTRNEHLQKLSSKITVDDNNIAYYTTDENDLLMFKKLSCSDIYIVSRNFFVICQYLNSVTGKPDYAIFEPEDLVLK